MKWYWWVLLSVAVLLTVIAIIAAVKSGKKKSQSTEQAVIQSNTDNLMTSRSATYQSLGRNVVRAVQNGALNKPCICSSPTGDIDCGLQPGLTQCIDCCKSKGGTAKSWGSVSDAVDCPTCNQK